MFLEITLPQIVKMPLIDVEDFLSLIVRFAMHLAFLLIIVRGLYYTKSKRRDYLFTFLLISTIIFLLCFLLENVKLEIGMALGLFAIFGIIRYRTSQLPIKEMTYLFLVIGIAVINALANEKISFSELLFTNGVIISIVWVIEHLMSIKHMSQKIVHYDKIDLILPERYPEMLADLSTRLGLDIVRAEVGKVDFLRDATKVIVYYNSETIESTIANDFDQFDEDND